MASLKSALAPFGRPQEPSVARAILMMAAATPNPTPGGAPASSPPAISEVPTVFQMFRLFAAADGSHTPPSGHAQQTPAVDPLEWNPEAFVHVVSELAAGSPGGPLDWLAVVRHLDVAELPQVLSRGGYRMILHVYGVATGRSVLPGEALVGKWTHATAQLAILTCALTSPGSVNWETVKPAVDGPGDPASPFRCIPLIEALVDLDARQILNPAIAAFPDLVLLALTMASPQANGSMRQQLLVPLLGDRLKLFPETSSVVKQMWQVNRPIVEVGIQRMWQTDAATLPRVLDIVQYLQALPEFLSVHAGFNTDFTLDLAILAFRREHLNLDKWLTERLAEAGHPFVSSCVGYLSEAIAAPGFPVAQAMSVEATAILFKCLFGLLSSQPSQPSYSELLTELQRVYQVFVSINPRLADLSSGLDGANKDMTVGGAESVSRAAGVGIADPATAMATPGPTAASVPGVGNAVPVDDPVSYPPQVDEEANRHYKSLYLEQVSVEQVVALLLKLRASPVVHDQQVYGCMIHTLFDEYRFLKNYPDRELRITGTLFGALAQHSVLSGAKLGLLLNHILMALGSLEPEPTPVGRLAKFGICALEQSKGRLHDFPALCRRVLEIKRLEKLVPELVSEVSVSLQRGMSGSVASNGASPMENEIGAAWVSPVPTGTASDISVPRNAPVTVASDVIQSGVGGGSGTRTGTTSASTGAGLSNAGKSVGVSELGSEGQSSELGPRPATLPPGPVPAQSEVEAHVVRSLVSSPPITTGVSGTPQRGEGLRASPSSEGGFALQSVNIDTLLSQQNSMEVPDSSTQDKIHFIFNNLSAGNLDVKETELMRFLEPRHVDFLAHYVVVKRASIEPNLHGLYIEFLTRLSNHIPKLFVKVFERSFINVRILLESEKIVSSSSERLLLKSLGSWIGALTLGRNKALLRKDLDIKELLLEAYSNGRLIAVVPFVAKVLVAAKKSKIFKPQNPWLSAILRLLKEIYQVPDLKLNIKFELPLLTKELGMDSANIIEQSELLPTRSAPSREGNPDFTAINTQTGIASPVRSASPSASPTRPSRESLVPDVPAPGSGGVPIFSLGGAPSDGSSSAPGVSANARSSGGLGETPSLMPGGQGGVRASVPGSDTVADLATIMASASLSSNAAVSARSGTQQQTQQQRHGAVQGLAAQSGGAHGSSNVAAAVAAVHAANAQHQLAATAAAAVNDTTIIPNLAQHIVISPSLVLFQTSPHLKRFIPGAVDRAVREIINPVVERSCAIATITTRELALKDFAHEMDAQKIQKAAKQMVQQLAGSLALVTCKEPLRVSMGHQLRPPLLQAVNGDQNLLEQTVQILCASNLEVGCTIIEHAATEKAARDINDVIAPVFSARRQQQHQRQSYGLLGPSSAQDVLRVYDDFARLPRLGSPPSAQPPPSAAAPTASTGVGYSSNSTAQSAGPGSAVAGSSAAAANSLPIQSTGVVGMSQPASVGTGRPPAPTTSRQPGYGLPESSRDAVKSSGPTLPGQGRVADLYPAATGVAAVRPSPVMSSPAAMAEAMQIAAAHAPPSTSSNPSSHSSTAGGAGENKLSTQQVLERFNTYYPQLVAAVQWTVDSSNDLDEASSSVRSGDKSLTDLPLEHEVQQCRVQISQAVKRSITADEASMAVAQKVFKGLYEGDSNLYREVHVALLESMKENSRRLSKELVSWLAYSDDAKKFSRDCIIALLRPGTLLHITSYDELVAKTCDNGRNSAAMDFAAFLVQRAIIDEPLTTTRELYLTLEVLAKVGRRSPTAIFASAPDGLVSLVEACREVVHRPAPSPTASSAASSGGGASLGGPGGSSGGGGGGTNLEGQAAAAAKAAKAISDAEGMDPPGSRETVASVLTEWQRLLVAESQPVPGSVIAAFVTQAKQTTLYNDEMRDRFMRIGVDLSCIATTYALTVATGSGRSGSIASAPYTPVEAMVRLVAALCKPETSGDSASKGVAMLVSYLQALGRNILRGSHVGHTRPHFRLFMGIILELSIGMPPVDSGETSATANLEQDGMSPSSMVGENAIWNGLEPSLPGRSSDSFGGSTPTGGSEATTGTANFQVLSAIASALNTCNPHVAPSFAFGWLQIVASRDVMARLLAHRSGNGWQPFRQLLVSILSFLAPHLGRVTPNSEVPRPIRTLYRGVLRVLLVLLHDFPEFLCDYHFAICDVIPPTCIQMRNLVLSAYPRSMHLPDPFQPNLKVDTLDEMSLEPRVLSNLTTSLASSGVKAVLDKYLQDPTAQAASSLGLHSKLLAKDADGKKQQPFNIPAINALVLYLGQQAIARTPSGSQPSINGSSTEVLQSLLADLDIEGRYHLLNGIVNQLRYPNNHTHYFSCVLLHLFRCAQSEFVKEQITRVLVERLIANRPHPWGLLITFIELIKNPAYKFWGHDFVRCAPQIERLFENCFVSCSRSPTAATA